MESQVLDLKFIKATVYILRKAWDEKQLFSEKEVYNRLLDVDFLLNKGYSTIIYKLAQHLGFSYDGRRIQSCRYVYSIITEAEAILDLFSKYKSPDELRDKIAEIVKNNIDDPYRAANEIIDLLK